jgi:hypothetical protein
MNAATTQPVLEAHLGKAVAVTYNGGTERVLIVTVDPDGFVCKPVGPVGREDTEFWLAFADLEDLQPLAQAVKSN